ncbi:flavoprotein [Kitasatospora sp. GAS1066B]|uniref:flavoprotein n=1 Tax=Kitasatospora sp. GAS1066B TaxID=3156271 RepID=UPI003512D771
MTADQADQADPQPAGPVGVPALGLSRLLLVVTGSSSAATMPFWLNWLGELYPALRVQPVLTRSAQRFVTRQGMTGARTGEALLDLWPEDELTARHVEWAEWAEAVLVYPASFHFLARLALGLADSPALLAAQCTTAPLVVAPALPPGGWQSPACVAHVAALTARPNTAVLTPRPAASLTTGRQDAWAPALFPAAIGELERLRTAADGLTGGPTDPGR